MRRVWEPRGGRKGGKVTLALPREKNERRGGGGEKKNEKTKRPTRVL